MRRLKKLKPDELLCELLAVIHRDGGDHGNLLHGNPCPYCFPEFGTSTGEEFAEPYKRANQRDKLFIKYVQSLGAVAAVKNDGWIDREKKKFQVASYAYFDYGIKEGDLVAIGDPYNYKMVVIIEVEKTWWRTEYYHFRDKVL